MKSTTAAGSLATSLLDASDALVEHPAAEPRMLHLVDRLSTIALTVAGLAAFGSTYLLLVLSRNRDWLAWGVIGVPAAIWLLGFVPRWRGQRASIQTGAVALLLVAPLLAWPSGVTGFIAMNSIAFAVIFPAVIAFQARAAIIVVILTTAILGATFTLAPPGAVTSESSVDVIVGMLFCLVLGLGYTLARAQWVGHIAGLDAQQQALRVVEEQDRREREFAAGRAAVERRIHETVLNTLSGISLGVAASGRQAAVTACRRDLDQLELGLHDLGDPTLGGVVNAALEVVAFDDLQVHVTVEESLELSASVALSLRDAVVECLRNVRRHANTDHATIHAVVVDGQVVVTVRDEGSGIGDAAAERFGIRNTLRVGMSGIDGSAEITSEPNNGTTVTLRVPFTPPVLPPRPPSVTTLLGVSRLGRVGLVAGNALFLLAASALSTPLGIEWLVVPLAIVQFLVNVAMALRWDSHWRVPLALGSMATIVVILLAAAASHPDCSTWPETNWTAGILCGSAAVLAFAAPATQRARALMIAVLVATGLTLVLQLPAACQVGPLISAVTASGYLAGIWLLLQWGDNTFAANRIRAAAQWERILDARASQERQRVMAASWSVIDERGRALIKGIALGNLDPASVVVRSRATTEAAAIRERLGLAITPRTGIERLIARLDAVAEPLGARIDAESLTPLSRPNLPPAEVCEALESLVAASAERLVIIRAALIDGQEDIIVTASQTAVDVSGLRRLPELMDDCEIVVFDDEPNDDDADSDADEPALTRVVISRPG